jgi:sugar lactone lactonase YvrE
MAVSKPRLVLEGICFGEGPRWHDGKLWFSDMYSCRVMTLDPQGHAKVVVRVPNRPSGLGWLPDGTLLVVSMLDRKLLRLSGGVLKTLADLSKLCGGDANDMVVDSQGRAYVGNLGYDVHGGASPKPTNLILVTPDGKAQVVADNMMLPNGTVITPDGKTLIVGESMGHRLTAFDIAPNGTLSNRRVWADLGDHVPDGICLDAEGAIWVSSPRAGQFLRVHQGGKISQRFETPGKLAIACMLGGRDRKSLYMFTSVSSGRPPDQRNTQGWVLRTRVDVPGAGLP